MIRVVVESPTEKDRRLIQRILKRGYEVNVLEPFYAYHHRKIRFIAPDLPVYVHELIRQGSVHLLTAERLEARDMMFLAAEQAVRVVEEMYPYYRQDCSCLIQFCIETLCDDAAEKSFKKNFCDRLGDFFSVNIMVQRLRQVLGSGPLQVMADTDVKTYKYLYKLADRAGCKYFKDDDIHLLGHNRFGAVISDFSQQFLLRIKLALQVAGSLFFPTRSGSKEVGIQYRYGISIVAPLRQLSGNRRGPDFLVDNELIRKDEIVYLPVVPLNNGHKERLKKYGSDVFEVPERGRFFSNWLDWLKVLRLSFAGSGNKCMAEMETAATLLFNYFRWQYILTHVHIKHFITHCDYAVSHVGRNIALTQAEVLTWYFSDSMNCGANFLTSEGGGVRYPFWSYLHYNHLVTWSETLASYYKDHPGSFEDVHVVGCLWAEHISETKPSAAGIDNPGADGSGRTFVVAAFDTTYTRNSVASYEEGLAFAEHILWVAESIPGIRILFKEKKEREIHSLMHANLGPQLCELYRRMEEHAAIQMCSNQVDASYLISSADMVVSFPFSSPTFEALSANKPGIWHDPFDYYRKTRYGAVEQTTHTYEDLLQYILTLMDSRKRKAEINIPEKAFLMDPYGDRQAISRFRNLLVE